MDDLTSIETEILKRQKELTLLIDLYISERHPQRELIAPNRKMYPPAYIIESILKVSEKKFGITIKDIAGRSRKAEVIVVKHFICYMLRRYTYLSLDKIGNEVGIDHTSVIHAISQHNNRVQTADPLYMSMISAFENIFNNKTTQQNG